MPPATPPPQLLTLITGRTKFAALWAMAKTADVSDALAEQLAKKAWSAVDIAAALMWHPDRPLAPNAAKTAASRAVAALEATRPRERTDLPHPRIVRVFLQSPATCTVEVGNRRFTCRVSQLGTRRGFAATCLDCLAVVPWLPKPKEFDGWLADELSGAEQIEQPAEASEDSLDVALVQRALDSAVLCADDMNETRDGRIVVADGWRYLYFQEFLLLKVRQLSQRLSAHRFASILRDLGWTPHAYQSATFRANLWRIEHTGETPERREDKLARITAAAEAEATAAESTPARRHWMDEQ